MYLVIASALAHPPPLEARCNDECTIASAEQVAKSPEGEPVWLAKLDQPFCEVWISFVLADGSLKREHGLSKVCEEDNGHVLKSETLEVVAPGRVRISKYQRGGSWGYGSSEEWLLGPHELAKSTSEASQMGELGEWREWDHEAFRGTARWAHPLCSKDDDILERSGPLLPRVAAVEGIDDALLGGCSVQVSSADSDAVVHGEPGEPADARIRAVIVDKELHVEIEDDEVVTGAASWIHDDHVEIWVHDGYEYLKCWSDAEGKPRQWAVRAADAAVFAGQGSPAPLKARKLEAPPGKVRLAITLPAKWDGITVVYSDSDDGKTQERLIATSPLVFGRGWTLGRSYDLEDACVIRDGRLEPELRRSPPTMAP